MAAEQLVYEAEGRADRFAGIDDVAAEAERSEVTRLRRVLELVMPDEPREAA